MLVNEIEILRSGLDDDVSIVTSDYRVLFSYEYPMLYTGKNAYGAWVIGSFLEEDEDDLTIIYYISFVLKKYDYLDFISRRRSYRDIFQLYKTAYILKCDLATQKPYEIYLVDAQKIEQDYWPHEQSYYPSSKGSSSAPAERSSSSLSYSVKLSGGLADAHLTLLGDSIQVQQAVDALLGESIYNLPNLAVTAEVFQSVSTEGSFKFNFEVNIKTDASRGGDLFLKEELFGVYQNDLIEYAIKYLPSEVNTVFYGDVIPSHFASLVEKTKAIYKSLGKVVEDQDLIHGLKECVHNAAGNIVTASKGIGSTYESIEFITIPSGIDNDESIGIVTADSRQALDSAVKFIDKLSEEIDDSEIDNEAKVYKIRIYNLNTESRKGSGFIILEDGTVFKPKITISGNSPLEETKYTQSIYKKNIIDVMAIGTRKGGRLIKLLIES